MSADEIRSVLRARAEALAAPAASAEDRGETLELVRFQLNGEHYAFHVHDVCEVGLRPHLTPVPGASAPVAGMCNLRGVIVAALDLKELLGLAGGGRGREKYVVVLGREKPQAAVLTDSAGEVRSAGPDDLRPHPSGPGVSHGHLVLGVLADGVVVLDAERVLASGTASEERS